MKFKILLVVLISIIALGFIFNKKNTVEINEQLLTRSTQIEKEDSNITDKQKEALYYMLAYNYKNPVQTGRAIFNSKVKSDYYKKNKAIFEISSKASKFVSKADHSNAELREYIKNNNFLNSNLNLHLEKFISNLSVVQTIPSSYLSTNNVYLYIFKAIKAHTALISHNYLEDKKSGQIKELYQILINRLVKADGNLLSTLLNTSNLKTLHKFIDLHKIFDTSVSKAELKKFDSQENHQKILLNDISETHQFFKKYLQSKKQEKGKIGSAIFPVFNFLKKFKIIGSVYTKVLGFLFPAEYLFNLAYDNAKKDVLNCFENYNPCIKNRDSKKDDPTPLQLSHLYSFTSNIMPNLNKLRTQIASMTD